ncbi:hypothetical protein UY3_02514 [Chelonia mydas]|uniref:Uncharacterized protein n=1 Tax=Chelonia mydas TaxID=8469 RepID=M7BR42_CHEMY|nr:hypothetical protein UY3_02514 [Chelonia mydas]
MPGCGSGKTGHFLWREDWYFTSTTNQFLIKDPSARLPSFNLPHHQWALLNRFRTRQGLCAANQPHWGLRVNPSCSTDQTIRHIVEEHALTKFSSGLRKLHLATKNATAWLGEYANA